MKSTAFAILAATALCVPALASAKTITAAVVVGHPTVIRWAQMFPKAFIPAVEERLKGSEHKVVFNGHYGTLASPGEELEMIEAGLAEMGVCNAVLEPDKLSLQSVTYYAPFVSADARLINETLDQLNKTEPDLTKSFAEHGVTYLGGPIGLDDYLLMTTKPVASMDDLKGMKIAAPGAAVNWLAGTGAVGVSGNVATYYNEIKTGVYDGVIMFGTGVLPTKLYEVVPHILKVGLGAQYAGGICANADWFEGLPKEVQAAMREAADATRAWYLNDLETAATTALTQAAKLGATVSEASTDMRQAWAHSMVNGAATWTKALDARGEPGSKVLSLYMDAMREAGMQPLRNWDKE